MSKENCIMKAPHWALEIRHWTFYIFFFFKRCQSAGWQRQNQ